MRTKIGVLVLMLDHRKKHKNLFPRPLDTLKNTAEYEIIFGDHLSYTDKETYLQDRKVDILFDRYPYQKYLSLDPLRGTTHKDIAPICNPRSFTELCKDKWKFQKYMEKNHVMMPPIVKNNFSYWLREWQGIAIAKPQFGSFGVGIELISAPPNALRTGVHGMDPTLMQKYIPAPNGYAGIAVRQLIQRNIDRSWIYRTIVARTSVHDPIVNAARGAHIERAIDVLPLECCEKIIQLSQQISKIIGKISPFIIEVGLDYVIDSSWNPIFIEANAQPKGKLKGLVRNQNNPSVMLEHLDVLSHPFNVMSKWSSL